MKATLIAAILATSLLTSACATRVAVSPVAPHRYFVGGHWILAPTATSVWIPAHYERRGLVRVRVAGRWRV
ncbi:MAG TPA: hypothetical protein VHL58_11455 [Thermoanaerobaculia bacterium]|nr:hypothetical protein [Thermoanaerobaculia bacterium]